MAPQTSRRVVITGMGVVSPLGSTVDVFWHLLSRGESAVRPITSFDTSPFQACLAAEVRDFDPEDFLHRKQARRMGRATQFAVASAMMATRDSGIDLEQEDRGSIGISIGTSIGGMKEAFEFHDAAKITAYERVNPFTMGMTFPNAISSEVAIVLGLHGPCETYSIGCSSTANAIGRAYEWIKSGQAALVVAGGTEAPLHPSVYAAMNAGRALAPDERGAIRDLPRPFDKTRCGMVLGEGAGSFILEEYEHARSRGVRLAVVTNKEARYTERVLDAHRLGPLFDRVVSGDTLARKKPDPAGVQACLSEFGVARERALFVGDSAIDAATARNAGIAVWLLPHGYNMGLPLADARPDRIVADFAALHDALDGPGQRPIAYAARSLA